MTKKNSGIGFIFLLIILLLTACSDEAKTNEENNGNQENSTPGVTDKEILVGTLGPQTGPVAVYDSIRKGLDAYFTHVNENGGVHGREIKLIAYDDQYQPSKTVQLTKRLIEEDKVFGITATVCTACTSAALDYYKEKAVPLIMVGSGADVFVKPPIENVIGEYALNYGTEAKVFLDYSVRELGAKKIAIAYQNDDFGKEGYNAVKGEIDQYEGVKIVAEVNYLATDVEFSSQAQKLKAANPDVILTFSSPAPSANLKKAMYKIGFNDAKYIVCNPGGNNPDVFDLAGTEVWEGTISSSSIPLIDQIDDEKMKLYKEVFGKKYPNEPLGGPAQLGWASGQVFVEGLNRAGKDLTRENFLEAFYTFDNWQDSLFTGITFSKENHYGVNTLFLTEAKDGQFIELTDIITYDPIADKITY